jgi:VWFA-related protein
MFRVFTAVLCAAASGIAYVSARQQPAFHVAADTVSVYATVLDQSGRLVTGLTANDFEVFDNGKKQALTVFASDLQPITIVIMLDRSGSMVRHFELVRKAAERFVGNLLEADRARVGSFSNRIQIDPVEFTDNRQALVRILRENLQEPGTTPLWNATAAAMTALAREPGRRVVLLFTDGHDTPGARGPNITFREVRDRSVAENIMVYGIGLSSGCGRPGVGQGWPRYQEQRRPGRWPPIQRPPIGRPPVGMPPRGPIGGGPVPGDVIGRNPTLPDPARATCLEAGPDPDLRELAHVGGGGYFELTNADDLETTFARVADELHQQYLLAFSPEVLDGKTHTIEVRVRQSHLVTRARTSYLADTE